jgi:MFS family permease
MISIINSLLVTLVPTSTPYFIFMIAFLDHISNIVVPSISSDFNESNQASWLGTSYVFLESFESIFLNYPVTSRYLLATCTFTPLYGRLCNVMGRRGANHSAVLFATVGILACGLSGNMKMLIISRFVRTYFLFDILGSG